MLSSKCQSLKCFSIDLYPLYQRILSSRCLTQTIIHPSLFVQSSVHLCISTEFHTYSFSHSFLPTLDLPFPLSYTHTASLYMLNTSFLSAHMIRELYFLFFTIPFYVPYSYILITILHTIKYSMLPLSFLVKFAADLSGSSLLT